MKIPPPKYKSFKLDKLFENDDLTVASIKTRRIGEGDNAKYLVYVESDVKVQIIKVKID